MTPVVSASEGDGMAEREISEHLRQKYGEFAEDIMALNSEDSEVVDAAVRRLVSRAPEVLDALDEVRSAKYITQRMNAVRVLAAIGTGRARKLLQAMAEQDRNADVRSVARSALAGLAEGTEREASASSGDVAEADGENPEMVQVFNNVRRLALQKAEANADPMRRFASVWSSLRNEASSKTVQEGGAR
jgi:HEAT repeat protein